MDYLVHFYKSVYVHLTTSTNTQGVIVLCEHENKNLFYLSEEEGVTQLLWASPVELNP